jgi:hypothetical protein
VNGLLVENVGRRRAQSNVEQRLIVEVDTACGLRRCAACGRDKPNRAASHPEMGVNQQPAASKGRCYPVVPPSSTSKRAMVIFAKICVFKELAPVAWGLKIGPE